MVGQKYYLAVGVFAFSALMMSPIAAPESDSDTTSETSKTIIEIAPYGWGTGLSGNIGLQGLSVPINLDTIDLVDDVEAGGMGLVRARHGDYFLLGEGIWLKYKNPVSDFFFDQRVDAELKFASLGAGKIWSVPHSQGQLEIAAFAGLQYAEVGATIAGPLGAISSNNEWIDPIAGIMLEYNPHTRWRFGAKLDASGWLDSDTEQVSVHGMATYALTDHIALSAGYRWADANFFGDDGLILELQGNGPLIGAVFTFDP